MRKLSLNWDGREEPVWAEKINGVLWVHGPMGTLSYAPEKKSYGQSQSDQAQDEIRAPMPGKIKKVLFEEKDKVPAGQTVVVMEAMKMEFELKTPVAAVVKGVQCQEGEQVNLNQLLVRLEPA